MKLLFVVSRKKFAKVTSDYANLIKAYEDMQANEYDRAYKQAMADGRRLVHDWAVEANYNIFNADTNAAKGLAIASFQKAIGIFSPPKPHHAYWKRDDS